MWQAHVIKIAGPRPRPASMPDILIKALYMSYPLPWQHNIGIYTADDVTARNVKAGTAGIYDALPPLPNYSHKGVPGRYPRRTVSGIIINHNDFIRYYRLGGDSLQTGRKMALLIVDWYNYTNAHKRLIIHFY
jgi:hypothetical protein